MRIASEEHAAAALAARETTGFKEDIEDGAPAHLRENGEIRTGGLARLGAHQAELPGKG